MTIEYTERQDNGKWTLVVVGSTILEFAEAMHCADAERRPWRVRLDQQRVFTNARYLAMMKAASEDV